MNTPNVDDIRTQTIPYNSLQDSSADFQLPRNISLHPTNTDSNINATHIKVNHPQRKHHTHTHNIWANQTNKKDIDTISHSNTHHNKIMKLLNLKSLYKYDSWHKAYIFEHSKTPANCSYILIFLKTLACYTITPDTHQWYWINTHEIMDSHNIAICNDTIVNMVWLPLQNQMKQMPLKHLPD